MSDYLIILLIIPLSNQHDMSDSMVIKLFIFLSKVNNIDIYSKYLLMIIRNF